MPRSLSNAIIVRASSSLLFLLVGSGASALAQAPIFPDQMGPYIKSAPKTLGLPDRDLLTEYGLDATESAEFATKPATPEKKAPEKTRFSATAWRLADSTGAFALFQSRRPPGATASDLAPLAAKTSDGVLFAYGNYVFQFTGSQPGASELQALYNSLPKFSNAPLPALIGTLPQETRVPNSERYILGPVSLQRFEPSIQPSVAAFRLGAEGQLARYTTAKGLLTLIVFAYPTPTMARDQAVEFQKIPMAMVKRTGPLVAITVAPPDQDAAERLLGKIQYQAQVTVNEKVPGSDVRGFAGDLLNMFALAGVLILFCILAGVAYGGYRILRQKVSKRGDPDAMTVLNIDGLK